MINISEVSETNAMIEKENLDDHHGDQSPGLYRF